MDVQLIFDEICRQAKRQGLSAFKDALVLLPRFYEEHPIEARAYGRHLRTMAEDAIARCKYEPVAKGLVQVVEGFLEVMATDDFDSYMLFMEWDRDPEKQFYRPRREVLFVAVQDLQDLADDLLDFLSISMPPRTGKSTMCIFFLTWTMGRHPARANVMSGHSDKLTKGFHQEALSIIKDPTYRFSEVFPESEVVKVSMADETISMTGCATRFPTLTCRSIEGTLTGAVEVGKDALLYMDDVVEDREEALNANRMDKLYSAYLNQLKDRMTDGAKQLAVATRWVPNDPIGRIEEQYSGDPRYRFSTMPALDANGQSNFVYMYDKGFSTRYYEDMRESLRAAGEEDSWKAKYQCEPEWIGGLMFAREGLRLYDELPDGEPDAIIAACDTKDKGKDYAVLVIDRVYGEDHFIDRVVCDNSLPEVVEPRIVSALVAEEVALARFESNSAGGRVADDVAKGCRERGHSVDIRKKFSTENKETRILVDSLWIKERCLFRAVEPDEDYRRFMAMLTHYTTEGTNAHDDAPDAMSMLKRLATSMVVPKARAVARRF